MPFISYDDAKGMVDELEDGDIGMRLESLRRLRDLWHGRFWEQPEAKQGGIVSLFRDLTGSSSNVGPDLKVVRNFVHEICVKYQSFFSQLPMISVPIASPHSKQRREQATKKERLLYGLWDEGNMNYWHQEMAWYLPLMGDAFLGIWPDFDRNIVRPLVRSPEKAYPIPGYDMTNPFALDAVIFTWKVKRRWAERSFPKIRGRLQMPQTTQAATRLGLRSAADDDIEIMEYSSTDCFQRWVGGIEVNGVQHDMGFNLFDQAQFIHVPGEMHGHGAVEQIVGLNELSNATLSLIWQAMIENVYPRLVLIDPAKAPEQIQAGPGAVIPINAGGNVAWLHPPTAAIEAQHGHLNEMERAMKELAAMPDVNFGQFRASIVTGRAINELQGAGTGSMVEMVQGNGLGAALVSWNSKALVMLKQMFADDTIALGGWVPRNFADMNPKAMEITMKGSEIVGSNRNRVAYGPAMDLHTKLVMQLQSLGAGLISRSYAREQIGIPDSDAMEEEIFSETITDGYMRTFLLAMEQGITQEQAQQMESEGLGYLSGEGVAAPLGPPLPELPPGVDLNQLMAPGPGAPPPGALPSGGPSQVTPGLPPGGELPGEEAPILQGGEAALPAPGGAPGEPQDLAQAETGAITLDEVLGSFANLEGVEGRVFLIGEIVQLGSTSLLEVAVTDGSDRALIQSQLPDLATAMSIKVVAGEPDEPWIEVTPGQEVAFGGAEPDFQGVFV